MDAFRRRRAEDTDYADLISEPFDLYDADSGELVAVYRHLADDPSAQRLLDGLATLLPTVHFHDGHRSSGRRAGTTRTVGYLPRRPMRGDYCHAASLAYEQPAEHAAVAQAAEYASLIYRLHSPTRYQAHAEAAQRILPDYVLPGGVFTSGIINENNPLRYHFDGGNIKGSWSAMFGFKHAIGGGHLAMPEWGLAAEIRDRSLFLFDGQQTLHGVTPIRRLLESSRRYTIVYYAMALMWNCAEPGAELERIQRVRTKREVANDRTHLNLGASGYR